MPVTMSQTELENQRRKAREKAVAEGKYNASILVDKKAYGAVAAAQETARRIAKKTAEEEKKTGEGKSKQQERNNKVLAQGNGPVKQDPLNPGGKKLAEKNTSAAKGTVENPLFPDTKIYVKTNSQKQKKDVQLKLEEKYGIDTETFGNSELVKWVYAHNYNVSMGGDGGTYYTPKYEGGFLGIGGKKLTTNEEDADLKVLEQIASNNERKKLSDPGGAAGTIGSAVFGAGDALTMGLLSGVIEKKAKKAYIDAGLPEKKYVSGKTAIDKFNANHKVANTAGGIVGSMALYWGAGEIVSGATSLIKGFASAPGWVQAGVNTGITNAVINGGRTAGNGGSAKDTAQSTAAGFVGGFAGSTLSHKVGEFGKQILFNRGWQNKIIPEVIRNGISSTAFSAGQTGTTYFLYPKEYRPTKQEIARDLGTAFALGSAYAWIDTINASKQSKANLDYLVNKISSDYESMVRNSVSGNPDGAELQRLADNVIAYNNVMEAYISGKSVDTDINGVTYRFLPNKSRFVGQEKYANAIITNLREVSANADSIVNRVTAGAASSGQSAAPNVAGAITGTAKIVPASGASATMPAAQGPPIGNSTGAALLRPGEKYEYVKTGKRITVDSVDGNTVTFRAEGSTVPITVNANTMKNNIASGVYRRAEAQPDMFTVNAGNNYRAIAGRTARENSAELRNLIYKYNTAEQNLTNNSPVKPISKQIEEWDKNGRQRDVFFDFGAPGSELQEVMEKDGVTEQKIQMDASKVLKILEEHPEMSLDVIKQLDKVVADPVLILRSKAKNVGNSYVMFGEIAGENGVPVMVAVRTGLRGGINSIENVSKITSAYTRRNTQNFINSSKVLGVTPDKKRAENWMRSFGIKLPSDTSNSSSN